MAMLKDDVGKGSKWMSALTASSDPRYQGQMSTRLPDQRSKKIKIGKQDKKPEIWDGPGLPPNSDGSPVIRYPQQVTIPATKTPADLEAATHGQHGAFCIESRNGLLDMDEWFHGTWQK